MYSIQISQDTQDAGKMEQDSWCNFFFKKKPISGSSMNLGSKSGELSKLQDTTAGKALIHDGEDKGDS